MTEYLCREVRALPRRYDATVVTLVRTDGRTGSLVLSGTELLGPGSGVGVDFTVGRKYRVAVEELGEVDKE